MGNARHRAGPVHWTALGAAAALTGLAALSSGPAQAAGTPARARAIVHVRAAPRVSAADPPGTSLVAETFKEAAAPGFTSFNDACLTGAPALPGATNASAGDHPLSGCRAAEAAEGPVPPRDAAGSGYLELTDARTNRTGAALFNQPIPASAGLDLTFDVWQYGGPAGQPAPADGVSFFLTDGEFDLRAPGAFGGSLGYAQKLHQPGPDNMGPPDNPGVAGGYLGVGFDVLGNYFANTEQRGYGCPASQLSPAGTGTSDATFYDRGPNMVTLRGPVSDNTGDIGGYCYITASTEFPHSTPPAGHGPWPSTLAPDELQGAFTGPVSADPAEAEGQLAASGRRVHVVLTPAPDPKLTITVDFGGGPRTVLDNVPLPTPVPSTYKFGFAASTGSFTDIHLIRNVVVNSDEPLPAGLDLVKQVKEPLPGHLGPGDKVDYEFVVRNNGQVPVTTLAVDDPKVGPVSCPAVTLGPGGEVTCTATYEVTAADAAAGHVANTAVASGEAGGQPVTSPPSAKLLELTEPPGLFVEKQVRTPGPYRAGQAVDFSYLVSNTGGVPLDGVHVTDDHVAGITCAATTLAPFGSPGYQTTCHGSYVITARDVFTGLVVNTATARGTADGATVTSPPAQARLTVGAARLEVRKRVTTPGPHLAGSSVRYEYYVTNTGPRTLRDLVVVDDHVASTACGATTLRPGQRTVCHGTYRVTAVDASAAHVTNSAQAEAIDPDGNVFQSPPVSVTIPVVSFIPVTG